MTIDLRHFHGDNLPEDHRQVLLEVHSDAYQAQADDPFVQRFAWFVDHWTARSGYSCVVAYEDSTPVGFAYGAPLTTGAEGWRPHLDPAPERTRTFAVSEVMVRPAWRKQGIAQAVHDVLLADRGEALAVLYVDTTHPRVQAMYESWGYTKVGEHRPFEDAPLYAVMLQELVVHT
ncbi:GNAT family N-acetyltransferase [Streptomyces sp. BE20]|uniref:GNAT family N-acetyltransferase n=1 Tax=unclassified Streptomyces TaxID=2593676 RepID=UPI002E7811B5|nr:MULTISPECIES: GNAT family N-acetyltransferase [unclassified Streptomyces]MED7948840.1 GNAT family N-acetyltransferase [Streptomyces sp. BE303]MEE1821329.1 GNAT family N-acetyltransferase [Streptomyces sp. BE20]